MNVNTSLEHTRFLVAVIDSTKARFLTLELDELADNDFGPNLIEREALHNPTKKLAGQELWANTKTGRNRGAGARAHSYDDHRENHMVEFERRFAQNISNQIFSLIRVYKTGHLLLIAEHRILGLMRDIVLPILPKNLKLVELAKDLCQVKPKELHEYLAHKKLLPERQGVSQK
ncbi:MAG: host attachment protein [Mastigocoleus sp. MO_167.B18]|uniref:host attachment protein n=1 Tax=Mastigocoleus sp. MO_188.B34 TaxID=3036635 RepID=UPI00262D6276|nr:host attachment protein [Mastigocoleus sp. MO_188.B34]MDJ0696969.1 host attachment protein [Mastigocoleus sp. MO_188.B34]MDJ0774885.1 host attachment protein [Mastigocoleus sp. MO_167.B18]